MCCFIATFHSCLTPSFVLGCGFHDTLVKEICLGLTVPAFPPALFRKKGAITALGSGLSSWICPTGHICLGFYISQKDLTSRFPTWLWQWSSVTVLVTYI